MKIGRSAAELLRIFDFQYGGRPPSWIWYDVILDHPRLVFDGPNILLKLHIGRVYTLQDIAIFIFGPFGLKLPIHTPLGEFFFGGGDIQGLNSVGSRWIPDPAPSSWDPAGSVWRSGTYVGRSITLKLRM